MGQNTKEMFVTTLPSLSVSHEVLLPLTSNQIVVFIDETKSIIRDVSSPGSGAEEFDDNVSSEGTVQGTFRGPAQDHVRYDSYQFSDSGPRSPSERFLAKSNPPRAVPQEPLQWPLPKDLEGRLVRHFVQNLALWVCYLSLPILSE